MAGRRHFDLAHELFHVLTWEAVETGGDRVEQLANNFAAALLMPSTVVAPFGSWSNLGPDTLVARLNEVASKLGVTSSALRWRLVTLGELSAARAREIPESSVRNNGGMAAESRAPTVFSKPFTEVLGMALRQGFVSARRAAGLLDVAVDKLPALLAEHGVEHEVAL